jgi:hypothetical protein
MEKLLKMVFTSERLAVILAAIACGFVWSNSKTEMEFVKVREEFVKVRQEIA